MKFLKVILLASCLTITACGGKDAEDVALTNPSGGNASPVVPNPTNSPTTTPSPTAAPAVCDKEVIQADLFRQVLNGTANNRVYTSASSFYADSYIKAKIRSLGQSSSADDGAGGNNSFTKFRGTVELWRRNSGSTSYSKVASIVVPTTVDADGRPDGISVNTLSGEITWGSQYLRAGASYKVAISNPYTNMKCSNYCTGNSNAYPKVYYNEFYWPQHASLCNANIGYQWYYISGYGYTCYGARLDMVASCRSEQCSVGPLTSTDTNHTWSVEVFVEGDRTECLPTN
ncbi:MAG TPA: hypothetical protein PLH57_05530 [Oligoflexia bacterium]|nr:hypothetical protein [Oligoflexia bacterium]